MKLKTDPEFKSLIPPLSNDERTELRASLQAEGCRDALVVWDGTIIDGHNRYDLCTELGIAFQTAPREFDDRDSAKLWIIQNQFARRNLGKYARGKLAGQYKAIIAKRAKENQATSTGGNDPQLLFKKTKAEPINAREEIATIAGVSETTIHKVETVEKKGTDEIKRKADAGDISTNRAYNMVKALGKLPEEHREQVSVLCDDSVTKVETLQRLHKSSDEPETNGTYDEIMTTGGFHYGDDLEKWCNYQAAAIKDIGAALKSLAKHHAREQRRARQETRAAVAQTLPKQTFNVIYADPPWSYSNTGVHGAVVDHYDPMPTRDICELPANEGLQVADNAVLFMWATNPTLADAFKVVEAWGFEYKTNMVWVKTELVKPGSGFYVRGRHELLFICTRGSFLPLVDVAPPIGSVVQSPIMEHSRKPDDFYTVIERLYPDCNYVELFARRKRDGWITWGDECS